MLVDQALLNLDNHLRDNDNEADSIVSDIINDILPDKDAAEAMVILEDNLFYYLFYFISPTLMPDTELNELIRKLNIECLC